jgi:membrane protease YdiL (CAAX protease family)
VNALTANPAVRLVAYLAATLVLGAVLAPGLYWFGREVVAASVEEFRLTGTPPFGYLHKVLTESDFARYFNRALLLAALVCLWPFARLFRLRWSDFAAGRNPRWASDLGFGFALAAGSLLLMGLGLEAAGVYSFKDGIDWGKALGRAATTAAGVALLEEFFFRGALFALLLRSMRPGAALVFLSAFFAVVHFLKPPDGAGGGAVGWSSGFALVGEIFRSFGDAGFLLAEFATLFGVGLVLGLARLRTGSLWLPIGLHAGWVFGVFAFRGLAGGTRATKGGAHLPWIGENLKTGLLPLLVIAATAAVLAWWWRGRVYPNSATNRPPA